MALEEPYLLTLELSDGTHGLVDSVFVSTLIRQKVGVTLIFNFLKINIDRVGSIQTFD